MPTADPRPRKKSRRVVLGEGHPWFSTTPGHGPYDTVQLTRERVAESILLRGGEKLVPLKFKNLGNWARVRLVMEVIDDGE
jgi:hypothetical protein